MKRVIDYFSYRSLTGYAKNAGKKYSIGKFMLSYLAFFLIILLVSLAYRLQLPYLLVVMIVGIISLPAILRQKFIDIINAKRFTDVDIYLHQMAYSFQRTPKINIALADTEAVSEGRLKSCIAEARDELRYGAGETVYRDALEIIEKEYGCVRIKALHRFMISVENKGGRYANSMRVLLEDFDRWVSSSYEYQEDIRKIKKDITIGIVISMVLAVITTFMCSMLNTFSTSKVDITGSFVYQLVAMIFLILCMGFYAYTQTHFNYNGLEKNRDDKQIIRDYNTAFKKKKSHLPHLLATGILVLLSAAFVLIIKNYFIAVYLVIATLIVLTAPGINKRGALKNTRKDVYRGVTEWLRELALNLADYPLLVSIENTYDDCPAILKNQLGEFIKQLETDPTDIVPYYNFLSEFEIMDISSAVRTLYSISEQDEQGVDETINVLVRRNNDLSDKAERTTHMDRTSLMRFAEYIPILFVALKMGVDMMLVVTMYL